MRVKKFLVIILTILTTVLLSTSVFADVASPFDPTPSIPERPLTPGVQQSSHGILICIILGIIIAAAVVLIIWWINKKGGKGKNAN